MRIDRRLAALSLFVGGCLSTSSEELGDEFQSTEAALRADDSTLDEAGGSTTSGSAPKPKIPVPGCGGAVDATRELLVTDLRVVEDPLRTVWTGSTSNLSDGAWTFGRLMTSMAGSHDPSDFVVAWWKQLGTTLTVNGDTIAARSSGMSNVLSRWPRLPSGKLDLTKLPFRLTAIVNRVDLRNTVDGSGGEARFVFNLTIDTASGAAMPTPFTVILEYRLPAATEDAAQAWAQRWHALGTLPLGSPQYLAALQAITDRFAVKGAAPGRPNGSAISQVRTNDAFLNLPAMFAAPNASDPWELRQFALDAAGALVEVAVSNTPRFDVNGTARLASFINTNESRILGGTTTIPASFAGAPFQAGSILNAQQPSVINSPPAFWDAPGIRSPQARHLVSVNTCSGCHGVETGTHFLHIGTRAKGQPAALSGFLTGTTVKDPVTGASRTFNDLARRATDLKALACETITTPLPMPGPIGIRVH